MDALKDRVGAFTEGILIMSCPVLAAVALKKVDLSSEGNAAVRGSISPLAAVSLFLSSLAFILLGIASAFKGWLPHIFPYPTELVFRFTKLLVHLCAVAQMLLAYMILLLISMRSEAFVALLTVFGPFVFCCGYLSVIRIQERIDRGNNNTTTTTTSSSNVVNIHRLFDNELKPSLEFSAAVTSLLFLGLEGLALEGETGVGQDLDPSLLAPIRVTFFFCVMASTVMLFAAVPPIDYDKQEHRKFVCTALHVSCGALTLFFAAPVLTIVFVLEREKGVTAAFVPYLTLLLFYVVCLCIPGGKEEIDKNEVTPPASMEMTKVTFTGFLAVTLPKFRDGSLSGQTHVFVISTAMCMLFGLAWRFLSHFKQRAAVRTAKAACLLTYVCLAVAVFPFMSMAMQSLADADSECHIPCNSTRPYLEQLDSFIACFNRNAIKTSSYALSSVKC